MTEAQWAAMEAAQNEADRHVYTQGLLWLSIIIAASLLAAFLVRAWMLRHRDPCSVHRRHLAALGAASRRSRPPTGGRPAHSLHPPVPRRRA